MTRIFVTDCEGPLTKNDNAFELAAECIPEGVRFFTVISRYDDVLVELVKREGYNAGDTLKLIAPFLKTYDVTDEGMKQFAAASLELIAETKETLNHIRKIASVFIVSTSFEHYIKALCERLDFEFGDTYCTRMKIDNYCLDDLEKKRLRTYAEEIAHMTTFDIPLEAKQLTDLPVANQETVKRLDEIFWKEIPKMRAGRMLDEIEPVGGPEKAESIKNALKRTHNSLEDVVYVGDSITDEEAFKLVRENGGLTISFNGNQYAIRNSEIAVISETSLVTAIIADVFLRHGRKEALRLAEKWNVKAIKDFGVDLSLLDQFLSLYPVHLPKIEIVSKRNVKALIKESSDFRKRIRGKAVGRLG